MIGLEGRRSLPRGKLLTESEIQFLICILTFYFKTVIINIIPYKGASAIYMDNQSFENTVKNFQSNWIGAKERGACIKADQSVYIRAGGNDIWGKSDECMFYSVPTVGDFSIEARIHSFEKSDLYAKACLMARESLDGGSAHVAFLAFPDNAKRHNNNGGYEFQYRLTGGGKSVAIYPDDFASQPPMYPVNYPDAWFKLVRENDCFTAYVGTDGINWKEYCQFECSLSKKVHLGLAVCSHSKKKLTLAQFSDIKINSSKE